jgi:hypothetical protein
MSDQIESFRFSFGQAIRQESRAVSMWFIGQAVRRTGRRPNGNPKGQAGLSQIRRVLPSPGHQPDRRQNSTTLSQTVAGEMVQSDRILL